MKSSQWPGLVTNASPFAIPPTAAVDQVNLASDIPGQVYVRGGMRKVAVAGGLPDIIDCFPCEVDGNPALIAMLPDGSLVARNSPAYGWQARVPLDPNLSGSAIVVSGYTQRFAEGGVDSFVAPQPDSPEEPAFVDSCPQAADGGRANTSAWAYFLDAASCDPAGSDDVVSGGSASIEPSCWAPATAAFCTYVSP